MRWPLRRDALATCFAAAPARPRRPGSSPAPRAPWAWWSPHCRTSSSPSSWTTCTTHCGASGAFEPLFRRYLAGVILATATTDSRIAAALHEAGVPLVLAVRSVDGLEVDCVQIDNEMAGGLAAQHLLGLGHRKVGFAMGPANTSTTRERLKGARRCLERHGAPVQEEWILGGTYTHASGYSSAAQLLSQPDPPTAIICGNDTVAIGALEAARRHGTCLPGRLSIIGFDDIPMAGWAMIGLTTVRQPMAEMAALAATRLAERIAMGPDLPPRRDLLPVGLVQRNSAGPAVA